MGKWDKEMGSSDTEEYIESLKDKFQYAKYEQYISSPESQEYFEKVTASWPIKPSYSAKDFPTLAVQRAEFIYNNIRANVAGTDYELELCPAIAFLPVADFNAHATTTPEGSPIIVLDIFLKQVLHIFCTELIYVLHSISNQITSRSAISDLLLLMALTVNLIKGESKSKSAKIIFEWAERQHALTAMESEAKAVSLR